MERLCLVSPGLGYEQLAGSWADLTNFTYTGPIVITDASAVGATNTFYPAVSPRG
jgi:hypothetical protein